MTVEEWTTKHYQESLKKLDSGEPAKLSTSREWESGPDKVEFLSVRPAVAIFRERGYTIKMYNSGGVQDFTILPKTEKTNPGGET